MGEHERIKEGVMNETSRVFAAAPTAGIAAAPDRHFEELDATLDRVHDWLEDVSNLREVRADKVIRLVERLVGIVGELRADAVALAEQVSVPLEPWNDRPSYVSIVTGLSEALQRAEDTLHDRRRREAVAALLAALRITIPAAAIRAAYEATLQDACAELLAAPVGDGTPLPGPDAPSAWLPWGRANATGVRDAGLPNVANFLQYVPQECYDVPADFGGLPAEPPAPASSQPLPAAVQESARVESVPSTESADVVVVWPRAPTPGTPPAPPPTPPAGPPLVVLVPQSPPAAPTGVLLPPTFPLDFRAPLRASPSRSSTVPPELRPPAVLPASLQTLDAYMGAYWLCPNGTFEPAPWRAEGYAQRLHDAFVDELRAPALSFARLWVFARAAETVGEERLPTPSDVSALADLWTTPDDASVGDDEQRVRRLREGLESLGAESSLAWRLRLVAEALRPSREAPLAPEQTADLFDLVTFRSESLAMLLRGMLDLAGQGEHPVDRLRQAVLAPTAVDEHSLAAELERARHELRKLYLEVHHAGGANYIERSHCREAWRKFIREVEPLLEELGPEAHGGAKTWKPDEMAKRVRTIRAVHAKIADRGGALYQDRHRMDRRAEQLQERASAVNEAMRRRLAAVANAAPSLVPLSTGALHAALEADEEFARRLLRRVLALDPVAAADARPFALSLEDLASWPDLVPLLPEITFTRGPAADMRQVTDVRRAAETLLGLPSLGTEPTSERLLRAFEIEHRRPLRGRLLAILPESERARVHALRTDAGERAWQALSQIQGSWRILSDLVAPLAGDLRGVSQAVEAMLDRPGLVADLALLHLGGWLAALRKEADATVEEACRSLLLEAEQRGEGTTEVVKGALQQGRFAEAHRLLRDPTATVVDPPIRQALSRFEARQRFIDPVAALDQATERTDLVATWKRGITGDTRADNPLRTAFLRAFLDDKRRDINPQNKLTELRVSCVALRGVCAELGLNPTWLPQLARYGEVIVLTPTRRLGRDDFVQALADQAAPFKQHLVVVLVPRISEDVRRRAKKELRTRDCTAVVVDDLDLCRMLNPGGPEPNLLLALLEVLLGAQSWTAVMPFQLPDGQNVALEMFVGRKEEARELATTSGYSRLFSGRKLGKSALLRYLEATADTFELPSRNHLRVVYVSAVGVDSESALVKRICEAVTARLELPVSVVPWLPQGPPAECLHTLLQRVLRERPGDNLLVVLDEADVFVEQQFEAYEREKEACLSFQMRSRMEAAKDAQGLPRVRFLFSGYRVTHLNRGAWANWGDVLRLSPLEPKDAADLVAGPLARLSIDAELQRLAIAHRCGYQPAVLLRFGERLLARLEQLNPMELSERQRVEVSDDDVAVAFEDDRVQEEIRTVVRNNFQGNAVGRAVFAAVLLEFVGLTPGQPLENAEERLLQTLGRLSDGDLRWLGEGAPEGEIRMRLRDLVERKLLVERRDERGITLYHLLFPHHLPVLLPLAQEQGLRDEIRSLQRAEPEKVAVGGRSVLPQPDLEELRRCMSPDPDFRCLAVVGGFWLPCLLHRSVGLPDRLGVDPTMQVSADVPGLAALLAVQEARKLLLDARPEHALRVLSLVGAGHVAPALVGGVDLLRWAVRVRAGAEPVADDVVVEPFSLGRWGTAALRWWFERVRGVNLPRTDALEEIHRRTSGIPLLVDLFEEVLGVGVADGEGRDLSSSEFDGAIDRYETLFAERVLRLTTGGIEVRLEPRELEILLMVATVHRVGGSEDLCRDLQENWDELFRPMLPVDGLGERDHVALAMVQRLGLLPTNVTRRPALPFERFAPLEPGDLLLRIVDVLAP